MIEPYVVFGFRIPMNYSFKQNTQLYRPEGNQWQEPHT